MCSIKKAGNAYLHVEDQQKQIMPTNGSTEICRCGLVYKQNPFIRTQCMIRIMLDHVELDHKVIEFRDIIECTPKSKNSFAINYVNPSNHLVSQTFLCTTENSRNEWIKTISEAKDQWTKGIQQKYETVCQPYTISKAMVHNTVNAPASKVKT